MTRFAEPTQGDVRAEAEAERQARLGVILMPVGARHTKSYMLNHGSIDSAKARAYFGEERARANMLRTAARIQRETRSFK